MALIDSVHAETEQRMKKSIETLKKDFSRIRTGRATPALLDGIKVDYYGSPMPVSQVATVSIPDARMIMIQPWEKSLLGAIEKAVLASGLGLTPKNDGNVIRLPIPPLSEERRRELAKSCKQISEDNKIAIRNVRRDSNEKVKKMEKDKQITEDELKKGTDNVQKLTDQYIKMVDEQLLLKEKEIMEN
jgi:ribosome recycling factor